MMLCRRILLLCCLSTAMLSSLVSSLQTSAVAPSLLRRSVASQARLLRGRLQVPNKLSLSPAVQDCLTSGFCVSAAYAWVQLWIELARREVLQPKVTSL